MHLKAWTELQPEKQSFPARHLFPTAGISEWSTHPQGLSGTVCLWPVIDNAAQAALTLVSGAWTSLRSREAGVHRGKAQLSRRCVEKWGRGERWEPTRAAGHNPQKQTLSLLLICIFPCRRIAWHSNLLIPMKVIE